ncbi:Transcriptional activator of acetoin dehydrogenase operon AcoR OS=Castellaniella defragrans (strain DSM / CCUG 39792 / 65Phen) OX=1437824 GN=BN940_09156 PE=4 SV=1 [Castellaniella denitrificans]
MPPSQYGPLIPRIGDEPLVASAWEHFVQNHAMPTLGVRKVVLDSWRRCQKESVDPGSQRAPGATRQRVHQLTQQNRDLCDAARPVLGSLRDLLRECGSLIMLTDPHGTILLLVGENRVRTAGEGINLAIGGDWNEAVIGTNAIGTAIAMRTPVQIHACEHFCLDVKRWTCAAAPVHDPVSGVLLGVINVSGVKETFHGHTLGLVMSSARLIAGEIAHQDAVRQSRLLSCSMDFFTRYGSDGLVLCDCRGRIIRTSGPLPHAGGAQDDLPSWVPGEQLDGLQLSQAQASKLRRHPGWLKPEWRHLVRDQDETLGTLLVIPAAAAGFRAGPSPGANAHSPIEDAFADILGHSEILERTKARARRIAMLDLPVLLEGETGAGKELFARALHCTSQWRGGPFVALNCGALTRDLLASELFGYVEGAFTGARRGGLPGKFEQADGGTMFLDEIGEMPLEMQPHLLRVLQDGIVVRLGDTRERRVSVRLIAASNRDLRREIAEGRFREDLYHRLCAVSLQLPPLRDRPDDIETIVGHLNVKLAEKYGCKPKTWGAAVSQALLGYHWPGNIRELRNVFEAAFALSDDDVIDPSVLPPAIARAAEIPAGEVSGGRSAGSLSLSRLADLEKRAILDAVDQSCQNMAAAARMLGISRSTLYTKLAAIRTSDDP